MLTPNQKNEIRARHERAARILSFAQLPTNAELIQIVHDLGYILNDETNRTRP